MWATRPLPEIAKVLGCGVTKAYTYGRDVLGLGPKPYPGHRGHRRFPRDEIVRLARAGVILREISRRVGCSVSHAGNVARAAGLRRLRDPASWPRTKIVVAYRAGLSASEIARRLGCAHSQVCDILHQAGVELRPRTDPTEIATCVTLWHRGYFHREIATMLGLTVDQVRYRVRKRVRAGHTGAARRWARQKTR